MTQRAELLPEMKDTLKKLPTNRLPSPDGESVLDLVKRHVEGNYSFTAYNYEGKRIYAVICDGAQCQTLWNLISEFVGAKTAQRAAKKRIRGIAAAAQALNVNRVTLWRAIHGHWHLPKLLARYEDYISNKKEQANA